MLLLGVITNLLNLLEVPAFTQMFIKGLIVIAAILADRPRRASRMTARAGNAAAALDAVRSRRYAIWIVLRAALSRSPASSRTPSSSPTTSPIVRQAAPVGIAAVGVTFVMILRGVDLSVGASSR